MASSSPQSNTASSNSPTDHPFDLDLALTMADYSGNETIKVSGSLPPSTEPEKWSPAPQMTTVSAATPAGVCTVCMEDLRSGTISTQLLCGHVYHAICIAEWLSLHVSCPLCRCKISGHREISPAVST
ncbi:RING-type E3 ubiquitin transferase [Sarracenia purpurea var. burkii]